MERADRRDVACLEHLLASRPYLLLLLCCSGALHLSLFKFHKDSRPIRGIEKSGNSIEIMVGSSWSSSSSCTSSLGSLDDDVVCVVKPDNAMAFSAERCIKFLCSYGGRILPRRTDGALRYVGGDNRVLSVDRSLQFYVLQRKLCDMCGRDVSLRCQLPTEDLDALISVTSDDDLANLLEEYDAASKDRLEPMKIRAFLFPITPAPALSRPPTTKRSGSRTSTNFHYLHGQNSSPAAAARVSPTQWCAAPLASRSVRAATIAHQPHRYLVHNSSHGQRRPWRTRRRHASRVCPQTV